LWLLPFPFFAVFLAPFNFALPAFAPLPTPDPSGVCLLTPECVCSRLQMPFDTWVKHGCFLTVRIQIAPALSTLNISYFDLDPEFLLLHPRGQPALLLKTLACMSKCPQNARPGTTSLLTLKSSKPSKVVRHGPRFVEVDGSVSLGPPDRVHFRFGLEDDFGVDTDDHIIPAIHTFCCPRCHGCRRSRR
jgi:hypothetical protein